MAWPATAGGDGRQTPAERFGHWYIGRFLDAMAHDRKLRLAFLDVNQMLKPATSLFAADLAWRVLRRSLPLR
jgi:hypothetical protein